MHICHVNLARGFRGGERQTELLIQGLSELDVRQSLVMRRDQPLYGRLSDVPGLDIREVSKPFWLKTGALDGELVHAHENHAAHLASRSRARGGCPYLITRRVDNLPGRSASTRNMYQRASCVVAISQAIAKILQGYETALNVRVIPSALGHLPSTDEGRRELRERWGDRLVIGHVGALDNSQKGQIHLIRAMHQVVRDHPQAYCVLLGSGTDEDWFRDEARGAAYIEFAGHVENVGDYLSAFDIFAFPSLHEGLGSSLLDAMDYALPIVASDVDGIPELVTHDDNGLLVPPGDESALTAALEALLSDPDRRRRYGDTGRQRSRRYVPANMAREYLELYRRILRN